MWTTGGLSDVIAACGVETSAGVSNIGYIINLNDIDKSNTVVSDFAIASLAYNPGAAAFACTVLSTDEPEGNVKLVRGQYRDGWDHNIKLRLMVNSTAMRLRLNELLASRVTVVYRLYTPTGRYFEIAGYELGLEVTDIDRSYNDQETSGGWVVSLGCHADFKEKHIPYILGTAPGTIVVDATEVSNTSTVITEAAVIAGVITINSAIAIVTPVAGYIIDILGRTNHYEVQKITDYKQEINIGDQLPVGTYTVKILYTS